MKCNKCGKEIEYALCHYFVPYDGSEHYAKAYIPDVEEGCFYIEAASTKFTMFEFIDSYEEFVNYVQCPECKKFPFEDGAIDIHWTATVVFGISKDKRIDEWT